MNVIHHDQYRCRCRPCKARRRDRPTLVDRLRDWWTRSRVAPTIAVVAVVLLIALAEGVTRGGPTP